MLGLGEDCKQTSNARINTSLHCSMYRYNTLLQERSQLNIRDVGWWMLLYGAARRQTQTAISMGGMTD